MESRHILITNLRRLCDLQRKDLQGQPLNDTVNRRSKRNLSQKGWLHPRSSLPSAGSSCQVVLHCDSFSRASFWGVPFLQASCIIMHVTFREHVDFHSIRDAKVCRPYNEDFRFRVQSPNATAVKPSHNMSTPTKTFTTTYIPTGGTSEPLALPTA